MNDDFVMRPEDVPGDQFTWCRWKQKYRNAHSHCLDCSFFAGWRYNGIVSEKENFREKVEKDVRPFDRKWRLRCSFPTENELRAIDIED